jgi:hypothetical protein
MREPVFYAGKQIGYVEEIAIGGKPEAMAVLTDPSYPRTVIGISEGKNRQESIKGGIELVLNAYLFREGKQVNTDTMEIEAIPPEPLGDDFVW